MEASADDDAAFNVLMQSGVYNIRKFMRVHPGGVNTLRAFRNRDIAAQMAKYDHNEFAYNLLECYRTSDEAKSSKNGVVNGLNGVNGKNGLANGVKSVNGTVNGVNGVNGLNGVNGVKDKENGVVHDEKYAKILERLKEIQRIEDLVDWDKPMLAQLPKLGPHYIDWINSPVDRTVRLFGSPFLESLTRVPWYGVLVYWIPIVTYLLWHTHSKYVACGDSCIEGETLTNAEYALRLLYGVIFWTFAEYLIHRFIFHANPGKSNLFRTVHFSIHGLHHKTPFDIDRQVFPPVPATVIALMLYLPLKTLIPMPLLITTGGVIGYLGYDMIHFYVHYGNPKDGSFLYSMKRYHANHHFVNPNNGYGISSKMWDVVFNTKIKMKPLAFSLSWK